MSQRKIQPPFTRKMKEGIWKAVERMESKQIELAKQPFKPSELLLLFVDPEYHNVLTEAYHLCEPSGHTQDLFVKCEHARGIAYIRFFWHGAEHPHAFYVPYRAGATIDTATFVRTLAPVPLIERFTQVAEDLIGIATRFAAVRDVLIEINKPKHFRTLAQVRYHWPCIVPILRAAHYAEEADRLQHTDSRSGAPIPAELGRRLAETNQTVAMHQLLTDVPPAFPGKIPIPYELRIAFR